MPPIIFARGCIDRRPGSRWLTVDLDKSAEIPDAESPVDDRIVIAEMNGCVRHIVDRLPKDYREAMVLHDLQGLTAAQTAEAAGCSVPTAKIRIHRARTRLRDALKQECEFYRDGDDVLRCDRKC